ncbi:MAG TPA: amidohydrolase family protein, partial [Acidimicrobiales bacterium]|nr:amidohydrolase family protein [Acidimicrobiales bacterium]
MSQAFRGADDGPILDSHCHAWRRWPYAPLVPDEDSRGTIEQLLYEMDVHGVREAFVVCARIDNNPDDVSYVAFARDRYPSKLHVVADLDCSWDENHHRPGSADRLRALDEAHRLAGFTHYVHSENDGWLLSDEAEAVFALAEQRRLIISLAASPAWQEDLRTIARRHPGVSILCHHLAGVRTASALGDTPGASARFEHDLAEVVASAAVPNIFIKVSGFHYASAEGWDHPWTEAVELFRRLFDAFGADRMCWGSDFPASTRYTNFRQCLEVVRRCAFLDAEERA